MALEEGKVKIEKFDGRDFKFWKMQIEDYLYQKKLYQSLWRIPKIKIHSQFSWLEYWCHWSWHLSSTGNVAKVGSIALLTFFLIRLTKLSLSNGCKLFIIILKFNLSLIWILCFRSLFDWSIELIIWLLMITNCNLP